MPNLFDPYTVNIPAILSACSATGSIDESGIGSLSLQIPASGRYPLMGSVFTDNPGLGDALTAFQVKDIDGVIPVPARALFPSYPVLLSRIDSAALPGNQRILFPADGSIELANLNPVYMLTGLYIYLEVTKTVAASGVIYGNVSWLAPT